jgi:hypothetical protein
MPSHPKSRHSLYPVLFTILATFPAHLIQSRMIPWYINYYSLVGGIIVLRLRVAGKLTSGHSPLRHADHSITKHEMFLRWRDFLPGPTEPNLLSAYFQGHCCDFCDSLLFRRKSFSGMLRRVALVRTDVSEELSTSIIRVTRIGELRTLAVTSNRRTLRRNTRVLYFVVSYG